MGNSQELFIKIDDLEVSFFTGNLDEENNFRLKEKLIFPNECIKEGKISDLQKTANSIKKNVLLIEQKINYTFKEAILILDNFKISFLNLGGFKRLNGTQISKENITYILNNLKSYVGEFEKNKKIIHIFNSQYCLDKKKLDNLPIGLFGDFYSHELSFNLINENDFKNLESVFKICNLKIKKILLESFVKGSLISDFNPKISTFFYIQINNKKSKLSYIENNSIKYEQKFNFGTEIILNDISKITSLDKSIIKDIILDTKDITKFSDLDLLEEKYFSNKQYRKIKKKLIAKIAEARINELCELYYLKNINLKKLLKEVSVIFLEIDDQQHAMCFSEIYKKNFKSNNIREVITIKKPALEEFINKASNIVQFGWKKEVIPFTKNHRSLITRIFQSLFH